MTTSSQGRAGSELSASLVRDYRAIISSLENTSPQGPPAPATEPEVSSLAPENDGGPAEPMIRARGAAASRLGTEARATPMGFAELRSKLAALSEVRDIVPSRRPADEVGAEPAVARPAVQVPPVAAPSADSATGNRRRVFGTAARAENEPVARRRRAASKSDAFTWQRLGVLTVCIVVAGGAAVALQSVVGRDEAKVAPEVIGNAAIASVAPSAPAPVVAPMPIPMQVASTEDAAPVAPPMLRTTQPAETASMAMPPVSAQPLMAPRVAESGPAVPGLTAFAAPDPAPLAAVPAEAEVKLPRQAPLPPPAPVRHTAAAPAAAPASTHVASAPQASTADPSGETDEADDTGNAKFGGDPVGSAVVRTAVTMRAAPKNGSATVVTLRSGQSVELVACDRWCEIIADGKRGFVYRRFVDAGAPKEANAEPAAAAQ